jgi:hypothetical protein
VILRLTRTLVVVAVAAVAVNFTLVGCGSGSDGGGGAYTEMLNGLKEAALANETYKAARQAKTLPEPQRYVIESFCNMAWQIPVNNEFSVLSEQPFIVSRIKVTAERDLNGPNSDTLKNPEIAVPFNELSEVVDLASLDADSIRGYSKACYG